jgi:hypothetical protein
MPLTMLLASTLQDAAPVRDLRPGVEHRYRAKIEVGSGDRFSYRITFKIVGAKAGPAEAVEPKLEMKLSDYRATVQGHEVKNAKMGGGVLSLGAIGLPTGLDISGPQGPFWLPLIALYLPDAKEEGDYPIGKALVGPGLSLEGKSTLSRKDKKASVTLDASVVRDAKPLGKLTVATLLDSNGWPRKAEGTLVSADGTYRFTLERG